MSVAGKFAPAIVNPVPTNFTEFTVSAAVPEEVRVSVLVDVVFNVTLPKDMAPVLNVSCGLAAAIPEPVRETVLVLPLEELVDMVIVPLASPTVVGSKLT